MAPGLDQERLRDPIESGEEIAEAEAKPDKAARFQPFRDTRVLGVTAVEEPHQAAKRKEQDRPSVKGRKGKNG